MIVLDDLTATPKYPSLVAHTSSPTVARTREDDSPLTWDLRRDLMEVGGGGKPYRPCESCSKLKYVPVVKGNSSFDPNLGLHLLNGVRPPIDRAPMRLECDALEGLVKKSLFVIMSYVYVFHSSSLISLEFFILRNFPNTMPFQVFPSQLKMVSPSSGWQRKGRLTSPSSRRCKPWSWS